MPRPPRLALAGSVLLAGLAAAACSGGPSPTCPAPSPMARPPQLATDLEADRLGTVVAGREVDGLQTLRVTSRRSVAELRTRVTSAVARIGLRKLSEDNEGFEAEIYFGAPGGGRSAVARVREDPLCPGRTTVQLSVSTGSATPAPG